MKNITLLLLSFISAMSYAQTTFAEIKNIDPDTGDQPYEIESGDLDGDGFIDLVMATYDSAGTLDFIKWYKNDGTGNFTIQPTVSSSLLWVDGLAIANIDNQFGNDIVATSANQNKLVYFLSDGNGGFNSETIIDDTSLGLGQVVSGDINLDGNIDLITVAYTDNKTVWYAGDGLGNFVKQADVENGTTRGPYYVDVADFDGDTDLDVIVGYFNDGSIELFYNHFIESGSSTVSWIKDTETVDSGSSFLLEIEFGDVNNDAQLDILKVDNSGGEVSWFNKIKNGTSTENIISDASIIARPGAVAVSDIDDDGLNDIIVSDGGTANDALIWFKGNNNAGPEVTSTLIVNNNFQMFDITIADFDDDMDNDIATVGRSSDTVDYFENQLELLSVSDLTKENFQIYPNPTQNTLNFKTSIQERTETIITDLSGKIVFKNNIMLQDGIDVSSLQDGYYILTLNGSSHFKFVKH